MKLENQPEVAASLEAPECVVPVVRRRNNQLGVGVSGQSRLTGYAEFVFETRPGDGDGSQCQCFGGGPGVVSAHSLGRSR